MAVIRLCSQKHWSPVQPCANCTFSAFGIKPDKISAWLGLEKYNQYPAFWLLLGVTGEIVPSQEFALPHS